MDVVPDTNVVQLQKYKRKKRKNPLRQAKRYGNKGLTGRGSNLSEDTFKYLVRVLELSNSKFDTPEEQEIFVNNTLDQVEDNEINYSSNQLGCRVIEKILPFANDATVMRFISVFGKDLRPLVTDCYASHVLQKLIVIAGERGSLPEKDAAVRLEYENWVLKCSNFVMNNLEDFVWDRYGNHVIRTCLETLAGLKEKETQNLQAGSKFQAQKVKDTTLEKKVLPKYKEVIVELARRLMLWPQFAELPYDEKPCGLLYTLIIVLKATSKKASSSLVRKLLEECFVTKTVDDAEDDKKETKESKDMSEACTSILPDVFFNSLTSRLLDAAIIAAPPKCFTKIYADLFLNNLGKLAVMPLANHQVQKLFEHCTEKLEFEPMYDEIAPYFDDILQCKYYDVLVSIATTCKRLGSREQYFIREMMKILHCSEPTDRQILIAPLLVKLTTFEQREGNDNVILQGSLMLQTFLTFSKPIKIVDSLLAMPEEELLALFNNMKGSYILESYMKSSTIGEKSRDKMFKKLKGNYLKLACSKYGSRTLEGLWAGLNLGQKSVLMSELSPKEAILNSHEYGKIISSKFNLSLFIYRKDDWMGMQEGSNKKRKLFEDIIGDLGKKKK